MQPMTSMGMSPSSTCQTSSKKHCPPKGNSGNSCNKGDGAGKTNGSTNNNGDSNAAANNYLQQLQMSLQNGQLPSANVLVSNFPVALESPQGQQLFSQTTQLLAQAGTQGQQRAQEMAKLINQKSGSASTASMEMQLSQLEPDSPEAIQLKAKIASIKSSQGLQQQSRSLINDPTMGALGSLQQGGYTQAEQLGMAIMTLFSQALQMLKSPSGTTAIQSAGKA